MCGLYNNGNKDLYVVWGSDILISGFLMKCHTNFGSFRYEEDRAVAHDACQSHSEINILSSCFNVDDVFVFTCK